jgi:hypothetical protein
MPKRIIKVIANRELTFFHIDAGTDENGLRMTTHETSEERIVDHIIRPALEQLVLTHFPSLREEVAIEIHFTFL